MVRGQRRGKRWGKGDGDLERKKKSDFQGKLSHETSRITSYFSPEGQGSAESSPAAGNKEKKQSSVLQQADVNKGSPHRIEMKSKQNKVTDYFPVRRSGRKTKKTVLEEIQKGFEEAVQANREQGLEIRVFTGKGRGVVATTTFHRGDFVVEYAGELISVEEAKYREANYAGDENTGCYMYYFQHGGRSWCVDATAETLRLGRLVNHSRCGNLMTKAISIGGKPRLVLVAKTTIHPDEEVTYDYGDRSRDSLRHHPWLAL